MSLGVITYDKLERDYEKLLFCSPLDHLDLMLMNLSSQNHYYNRQEHFNHTIPNHWRAKFFLSLSSTDRFDDILFLFLQIMESSIENSAAWKIIMENGFLKRKFNCNVKNKNFIDIFFDVSTDQKCYFNFYSFFYWKAG